MVGKKLWLIAASLTTVGDTAGLSCVYGDILKETFLNLGVLVHTEQLYIIWMQIRFAESN